jgi:hypothetical protein
VGTAAPELSHVERRTTLLVAALEGAISHAVYNAPQWLGEGWFLDDLVALGKGYVLGTRSDQPGLT